MKTFLRILSILIVTLLSCTYALARNTVLTAEEVRSFLNDRTMTITEAEPDKKTGKIVSFKAYFDKFGTILSLHPDGSTKNFSWVITEHGSICVRNNMRWGGGGICGFIVSDDGGSHKLYRNRRASSRVTTKNGRPVFMSDWKHFLTFSDTQEGNKL